MYPMKKIYFALAILSLALVRVDATEQDSVNRCGAITPTAAVYTYSKSKGLFAGVSLEGAVIGTQRESNFRYYGQPVRADGILSGEVRPPPGAAPLRRALTH